MAASTTRRGRTRQTAPTHRLRRYGVGISGTMSANAILRRYPETSRVFEALQVDCRHEGDVGVDELAWRHGLSIAAVLGLLEEVVRLAPHPAEARAGRRLPTARRRPARPAGAGDSAS